jgi:hypothetical protein
MEVTEAASKLGRLLERRIEVRFSSYKGMIEIADENTLVLGYGECCFGIDHMFRCGSKQVYVQEKFEAHAPRLRDIRHFLIASAALAPKIHSMEPPLKVFLSRRPVTAPESLFSLQAAGAETLAGFTDIEAATEALYERVCRHFGLEPKPLTVEQIQELATLSTEYEASVRGATVTHRLQPQITAALKQLGEEVLPPLINGIYGEVLAQDIIAHIKDICAQETINDVVRFFKSRRATPLEYDTWVNVLGATRPIQLLMEQVNAETGRRIYSRGQIGEPAIQPSVQEQLVEKSRLFNRNKRRAIVTVIKESSPPSQEEVSEK